MSMVGFHEKGCVVSAVTIIGCPCSNIWLMVHDDEIAIVTALPSTCDQLELA